VAGWCEHSNGLWDSTKSGEFFLLSQEMLASQQRLVLHGVRIIYKHNGSEYYIPTDALLYTIKY
jgi:hypothetical protein